MKDNVVVTHADVLIVGGGFSGIALASSLVKRDPKATVLISRKPDGPTYGIAYETDCPLHLLNVPAKGMSAFPDAPTDFIDWAAHNGIALGPNDFAPRLVYRQYLETILNNAIETGRVAVIDQETIGANRVKDGWECTLRDGSLVRASSVILAFGGFPPAPILELKAVAEHPAYIANPWIDIDVAALRKCSRVGIIGSGLTALDVVLSLESKGFRGHYTLLSRRGLMPHVHDLSTPALPPEEIPIPEQNIRKLVRNVRHAIDRTETLGTNWRAVSDGMRPKVAQYWLVLSDSQRERFLRHIRPFWEVHRHRVAPQIAHRIAEIQKNDRLSIAAGRLLLVSACEDGILVPFARNQSSQVESFEFDLLVNCTGPSCKVTSWPSPLLASLISDGRAATDPLERGISSDQNGTVVDPSGHVVQGLFVLGHPRRGQLWESTAVPELRVQASTLAEHLAQPSVALAG